MAAKQFFLPYQAATINAVAEPGATLTFYQTGTTTKLPIYTTALLDTELANPVRANAAGRFADIYLDESQTYRLIIKDRNGIALEDIDPFIPGTIIGSLNSASSTVAPTRTELSGMTGTGIVYLAEAGREGHFKLDTSNLSAKVTADPNQGIYVALASDPTGASGAWVRKFGAEARATWWGVTENDSTNDYPALMAALATLKALRLAGGAAQNGAGASIPLRCRGGIYLAGNKITFDYAAHIKGDGSGLGGGAGTRFRWNNTTTGIAQTGDVADGWVIEDCTLYGGYNNGDEAEFHAVDPDAKGTLRNVSIYYWAGDGIYASASIGATPYSNVNGMIIDNVTASNCRRGLATFDNDTNGCKFSGFKAYNCRWAGIWEESGFGNHYPSYNVEGNARSSWNSGAANRPCSYVHYSGHWYGCVKGQEAWCSTNAPSGTAASNQGWIYWQDGSASPATGVPTWFSGINVRAGGGIIHTGVGNKSVFDSGYQEGDELSQVDVGALIVNPSGAGHENFFLVSAGVLAIAKPAMIEALGGAVSIAGDVNLSADVSGIVYNHGQYRYLGPQTGSVNGYTYFDTSNASHFVVARSWLAGVPQTDATVTFIRNSGTSIDSSNYTQFYIGGNRIGYVDSSGLLLDSGKVVKVNGNQVVGARQTGTPADATDLATAITLVNALKAKLVAHGLIS